MRRNDREVTDDKKIDEIILNCNCCRLGFMDGVGTYILPLNFGFKHERGIRTFYFHGAKEGKKIRLITAQPHVGPSSGWRLPNSPARNMYNSYL